MAMHLITKAGILLLTLCFFAPVAKGAEAEDDFVLVVNVNNDLNSISREEAERIFLNKKRTWPDGKKIAVVINENTATADSFSHTVLRRSPHQFLVFRKKMLFRGQGMPPPTLKTDSAVIEFIADNVGGISYVSPDAITSAVKVVSISQ